MFLKLTMKTILLITFIITSPLPLIAESANETTSQENKKKLEDKKWTLKSINSLDKNEKKTFSGLHLGFIKFLNGSIEGQSTCNIYTGVYSLEGTQKITIYRIGTTELKCNVGNKMAIESLYVAGLEQVKSYKLEKDQLILLTEGNQEFARFITK